MRGFLSGMNPRIVELGDSAWLALWPDAGPLGSRLAEVHAGLKKLDNCPNRPAGVTCVTCGYESLAVRYDSLQVDPMAVQKWMTEVLANNRDAEEFIGKKHEIPVCYALGEDLQEVAMLAGLTPENVISEHSRVEYTVAMIGFAPGFPYLVGLPKTLHLPRLATPRQKMQAGAVAIAAEQAGIYPCESPGGWRALGQTDLPLFDPLRSGAESLLRPGDRVKFLPVKRLRRRNDKTQSESWRADVEVLDPGFFTSVQDLGRPAHEHIGVSPGGAMDAEAVRVANILLGNPENTAGLEITLTGPRLRFRVNSTVVLVGANSSGGCIHGRAIDIRAGDILEVGRLTDGMRAILAVTGGFDLPLVLGSRSTDVRGGFGGIRGRKLNAGDLMPLGIPPCKSIPIRIDGTSLAAPVGRNLVLRILAGPQQPWFESEVVEKFQACPFEVTPQQDRMGMCLRGHRLHIQVNKQMRSQPVCTGTIQIPPDGRPVVLMAQRQTHGGYPQIGCIITADLPKLARAMPGTRIRFQKVNLETALTAMRDAACDRQMLRAGLMCRS